MVAQSGLSEAVRAISNVATAQVRKETLSRVDVKGLGRPKEFIGREEDFQQWSKKTGSWSRRWLDWSAEQPKEISTEFIEREFLPIMTIDLEFLPTDANKDRGVQNLEFVLQQTHTAFTALTSCEANDIVAHSPKNPFGGMEETFASKNGQRALEIELKNVTSASY